jgi:hypothetical protein
VTLAGCQSVDSDQAPPANLVPDFINDIVCNLVTQMRSGVCGSGLYFSFFIKLRQSQKKKLPFFNTKSGLPIDGPVRLSAWPEPVGIKQAFESQPVWTRPFSPRSRCPRAPDGARPVGTDRARQAPELSTMV